MLYKKVTDFPLMHPGGLFEGTHLHDYYLDMVEKRKDKRLVPGDCFGYYGASGWWYLYDHTNAILMSRLRRDMEKDKIELDNYRNTNTPFEVVKRIYESEN